MKELQAGLELVKTKYIQFNRTSKRPKPLNSALSAAKIPASRRTLTTESSIALPQLLSIRFPLERLRRRTIKGIKRLEDQAKQINQLSAELENAVLELKAIASEINPDWRALQATQNPTKPRNICQYQITTVPQVQPNTDGTFLLISKPIDLFQAEREATLLAQTLRKRASKKYNLKGRGKLSL